MATIALDFDGVIHAYSKGWQDGSIYDGEIEGWREYVGDLQKNGCSVAIMSTTEPEQIYLWLKERGVECEVMPFEMKFWNRTDCIGITNRKIAAKMYIDDRAVKFNGSFDALENVVVFQTWQEKREAALDNARELSKLNIIINK